MTELTVKRKGARAIKRNHPWVFSGALNNNVEIQDGEVVGLIDTDGNYLGVGHFHNASIAVRVLSREKRNLNYDFWYEKLNEAWNLRKRIGLTDSMHTNAFRWVHGEGDGLSGLIIDVFNDIAVIQCHTIGMHKALPLIVDAMQDVSHNKLKGIYDKSHETLPGFYENGNGTKLLKGNKTETTIKEYNIQYEVDVKKGQKTGFFLDQRDNRKLLSQYVKYKDVLNAFAYTGGFSINAWKGNAASVTSVDTSEEACELNRKNTVLNGMPSEKHQVIKKDVMDFLKDQKKKYDVIVLDPPAYAKTKNKRHEAVQAYKRLNARAMQSIKPGGLIFTFSCSHVVHPKLFSDTIVAAALEANKDVKAIHRLSQAADHPVNIYHSEGIYLKGLVLEVN